MKNCNFSDRRIEKIHLALTKVKLNNPALREDQFLKLISKIGKIEPELSDNKAFSNKGQVIVSKALLVETMREFLTTCVSCELLLTNVFGEALSLGPRESYHLRLSDIENKVKDLEKLMTRRDYVNNALEFVSEVSVFHSFVASPHSDQNYNHQRTADSSAKALGRLIKLIYSSGYSVSEIITTAVDIK